MSIKIAYSYRRQLNKNLPHIIIKFYRIYIDTNILKKIVLLIVMNLGLF